MRRVLARLHRWIGLTSGLVVFIVGVTGAIYVWEAELFALTHPKLVHVAPGAAHRPADELLAAAQAAFPAGHSVTRLTLYGNPRRAAVAVTQKLTDHAPTYFHEFLWYEEAYLDPSTGRVLGTVNRKYDWIFLTRMIHTNLLLADRGTWIVGGSTLVFVLMVLVGVALWWPRNSALLASRLRLKLSGNWKRIVFDSHNVLGFYGTIGMLILALTGPVWTWRWYQDAIVWLLTGRAELVGEPVPVASATRSPGVAPFERALVHVRREVPDASRYMIDLPGGKAAVLTVGAVSDRRSLWEEYERYYFHPVTGAHLGDERFEEKNLGMRWRNSNYGIHTGTLFGWPSQVLASVLSLLAASLPVTGLLIWFPRWRRRSTRASLPAPQ